MLQSTLREQPSDSVRWCVVYDARDGHVVHTHQFIGDDASTSESEARNARARMALHAAEQHGDATHFRVLHAPPNFQLEPGTMCRVDLASGELVTLTEPHYSLREFVERARTAKERKPTAT